MLLLWIILATVTGGLIAVSIAHWLAYRVFAGYLHHMVSLSVGVLLSVALLHLLPEAFETAQSDAHVLFGVMLASLIGFFVLEKIALLRHNHHHEAMVAVQDWLVSEKLKTRLIMQVHDELVLEAPDDEVALVRKMVPQLMSEAGALKVPLLAEIGVGKNWEQAH